MKASRLLAIAAACWAATAHPLAQAHQGHGLPGISHWHATDTLGVLLLVLALGAAAWWRGRK